MKIDIHTHTRKCKSGDAPSREISPKDFCETVLATEVGIVAITNHNVFDLDQFVAIKAGFAGAVQVWPGIELDILSAGVRGHLLVIVSPDVAPRFSEVVGHFTKGSNADQFTATIEEVLATFESLNPLYIAHYKHKRPAISDEVLDVLIAKTRRPECVIKEVTNAISAGIYISHGHASIYGSDVHDWLKYQDIARDLPDLRLPVDSFEHFCLLLKKDPTAINTVLDRKTAEELAICPFPDGSVLRLKAYNDINVIFGPKGTGKSCILGAIAKHYSDTGTDARVYESSRDRLEETFDIKGKSLTINLNAYEISYCQDEIEGLRGASEVQIASLEKFTKFFKVINTNTNAKKIVLKDIDPEDETSPEREFRDVQAAHEKTREFAEFLSSNNSVRKELTEVEITSLTKILSILLERLSKSAWDRYASWKVIGLMNKAIVMFRREIERKTGNPAKPTTTGFRDYAMNRLKVEINARQIITSLEGIIPLQTDEVGKLDDGKGNLQFITEFKFQTGAVTDGGLFALKGIKKTTQKAFTNRVRDILAHVYSDDLFHHISELNSIEDADSIKTVLELILFKRFFAVDGQPYTPSSGEASMVMLQQELGANKDVYVLDEPEVSLGNEYISDVIVPMIKELARAGKKIFISTHDANIAVRTLPYSSIYRCHGQMGYRTFVGNPFTNNLVNLSDSLDSLDWKKVSMKTLEGGEQAFGERGRIYGNH